MNEFSEEEVLNYAKELCELAEKTNTGLHQDQLKYLGDYSQFALELDEDEVPRGVKINENEESNKEKGIGLTILDIDDDEIHLFIPYEFINEPERFKDKMELNQLTGLLELETWMKYVHEMEIKDKQAALETSIRLIEKYQRRIVELKMKQNGGKIIY